MAKGLDLSSYKLDIIVVAGQSNAQGNGQGSPELCYKGNEQAFELTTLHPVGYIAIKGSDGSFIYPFIHMAKDDYTFNKLNEEYHDERYNGGFYLSFADLYCEKYLKEDRKLIIVKAGSGGTGFSDGMWQKGGEPFERMMEMIDMTLSLNKENKVVGFLWHQGECDVAWGKPASWYEKELINLFDIIREKYGKFPLLAGDFSKDWALDEENSKFTLEYSKMFKDLENKYELYKFVPSDNIESNAKAIGNDDAIHFSRKGQIEFGKRYFSKYEELK